jgi:mono/diheme cytochrome c family protein
MPLSPQALAYGAVAVVGATLFAIGSPAQRTPEPIAVPVAAAASPASPAAAPTPTPTPAPTSVTAAGITLRSLDVEFPDSDQTFQGPGSEVVNNNCTACHSPGMVLTQPRLAASAWQDEVAKMRTTYKAPIAAEDVAAIVAYLADRAPAK